MCWRQFRSCLDGPRSGSPRDGAWQLLSEARAAECIGADGSQHRAGLSRCHIVKEEFMTVMAVIGPAITLGRRMVFWACLTQVRR